MSRWPETRMLVAGAMMLTAASALALNDYKDLGRAATAAEIAAWNIDVRADFEGLPKGSGTVEQGEQIWDSHCATCHGTFGESNAVFNPLVGGTTAEDIKTGRAATLASSNPTRTALSTTPTVATLWDYIHRAMPWNAPKSLSVDQVYAVLAYLLNLGDIIPSDFTLNEKTIRDVQKRMPNRNGMVRYPGLWDRRGKPDTHNAACMKNCEAEPKIISFLPDFARDSHGNLALQNREWGAIRGANTEVPEGSPAVKEAPKAVVGGGPSPAKIAAKAGCLACHGVASKIVGPGFNEVAGHYKGDAGAADKLIAKVRAGGSGAWGAVPMPAQKGISDDDLKTVVGWVLSGAPAQ